MIEADFDVLITGAMLLEPVDGVVRAARLGIRGRHLAHVSADGTLTLPARRYLRLPVGVIGPGFINTHYRAGSNFVRGVAPDCCFATSYTPELPQASWLSPEEALALSRLTPGNDPLDRLIHNSTRADVETIIVNGQVVIEQGVSTLVDETLVRVEADSVNHALWQRGAPLRLYPSSSPSNGVQA